MGADERGPLGLAVTRGSAYDEPAVGFLDLSQLDDRVEIDDVRWTSQSHGEQWDEALPARKDLRFVTQFAKERDGFWECLSDVVLETRGLHVSCPS